jgi:hypothetical protein
MKVIIQAAKNANTSDLFKCFIILCINKLYLFQTNFMLKICSEKNLYCLCYNSNLIVMGLPTKLYICRAIPKYQLAINPVNNEETNPNSKSPRRWIS